MSVYAWGTGTRGRLGTGNEKTQLDPVVLEGLKGKNIVEISCGEQHSLALTEYGTVYSWGRGTEGQHGNNKREKFQVKPDRIRTLASETITQVSCGAHHNLALTSQGEVFQWGKLHRNAEEGAYFGVAIGLAGMSDWKRKMIDRSHKKYYAGRNKKETVEAGDDKVTYDKEMTNFGQFKAYVQPSPVPVIPLQKHRVTEVAAGYSFSIAITDTGKGYSWGFNDKFQLGLGHRYNIPEPVIIPGLERMSRACCGQQHTVCIDKDGNGWSWGLNVFGQLGQGKIKDVGRPQRIEFFVEEKIKLKQVACGSHHTVAVTDDGRIFSWGSSEYGQQGGTKDGMDWEAGAKKKRTGKSKEDAYYYATPRELDAFDGKKVATICCGALHNVVTTENGEVYTWGWGINGALGHGNRKYRLRPSCVQRLKGEPLSHVAAGPVFTFAVTAKGNSTFAFDFKQYINSKEYSDIEIHVQGKKLHAHKVIIFSRCPRLRAMWSMYQRFSLHTDEDPFVIPNVEYRVFLSLLYYLYTDHLKVASHLVEKLSNLAKELRLPRLVVLCERYSLFKESVGGNEKLLIGVPPSKFSMDLRMGVNDSDFSDVTFGLSDGSKVSAHRIVLAARCDYFRTIFESSFREKDLASIPMLEIPQDIFLALLSTIYTNGTEIDPDLVVPVLLAADRFLLDDLKERLEKLLEPECTLDTVADLLLISEQSSSPRLKKSCVDFIVANYDKFKATEGLSILREASPTTLRAIEFLNHKQKSSATEREESVVKQSAKAGV